MSTDRTLVGEHAGVRVYRTPRGFLKCFDEPARAERERVALEARPECVRPEVLEHGPGELLLSDVRAGRDPRRREVEPVSACWVLGRVHRARPVGTSTAEGARRNLLGRVRGAEPWLRVQCERMVVTGDAFCHGDLHASNWICEDGQAVGLMDWASSGYGDPESDLAQLGELPEPALEAWESASGRVCDRDRLRLYQLVEAHEAGERPAQVRLRPAGRRERSRCLVKPRGERWGLLSLSDSERVVGGLAALGLEVELGEAYAGHACNDVVRLRWRGQRLVLKIFNKPLPSWLVPLEARLAEALRGAAHARVVAPLALPHGGRTLRFEDRVAVLYPDLGGEALGNTGRDLVALARAQAELHALGTMGLERVDGDHFSDELLRSGLAGTPELALAEEVLGAVRGAREQLPACLVHGGLHRDHVLWSEGRLALLDFEKVSVAPRAEGLARSAYHMGFRANDERADPRRMVAYARAYSRQTPLAPRELEALPELLLGCFLRDLFVHRDEPGKRARFAGVLEEFLANRDNLAQALGRYVVTR